MEFETAPVGEPMYAEYEVNGIKMETASKFNSPTINRKYIKILALCLTYAPADIIYPNTRYPLMHQVRDMCRQGLLERYTRKGDRKYYYKTTDNGRALIFEALAKIL